jgi:ABC-type multidrug transport system fused ATPase/permease subunit
MRELPLADPGTPDLRSPGRYLWWLGKGQMPTLVAGAVSGILWAASQAVVPAMLGAAINSGVVDKNTKALAGWCLALLGAGVVQAVAGVFRHRAAVSNWLTATFRTQQLLARKAARLGVSLQRQVAVGDVVTVTAADVYRIGGAFDVSARAAGAVVSFFMIAVILLWSSVFLGIIVLLGVPLLTLVITPLLRPLQERRHEQRELTGDLARLGADTVAGLRVLRGIGGEDTFLGRYRNASQLVRFSGVRVARIQATLDAAQVLLPGIFVVLVTWLGARLAVEGELKVGTLVAFYGYAAFLVTPLRTATEAADKLTSALVSAARALNILRLEPTLDEPVEPVAEPPAFSRLEDSDSGLVVEPGRLLGVASAVPESTAALADRLGRFTDPETGAVTLGGTPLRDLPLDFVRRRILVSDKDPQLFTGRLRDELDPSGRATDDELLEVLASASAEDILEGLTDGLDSDVEERGRSFSGGQRQRLVLARALFADPEILVLDEPTSAVDAHTEVRIAERLRAVRAGCTTVVMSTSPLLLEWCDDVAFVVDGKVSTRGTHRSLMHDDPVYRAVVTRGEADDGSDPDEPADGSYDGGDASQTDGDPGPKVQASR